MPARKKHRRHQAVFKSLPGVKDSEILTSDTLEKRLHGVPITDVKQPQPLSPGALQALELLEKGRLLMEAKKKEQEMPDIKTALESAIQKAQSKTEEMQQEQTMQETPVKVDKQDKRFTTNVTRCTFNFIRDNPGVTASAVMEQMLADGHKYKSVSSLLGQMVRARIVMRDDNERLTAVVREYIPLPHARTLKRMKPSATRNSYGPVVAAAKAAKPAEVKTPEAPQINSAWDAETLLNNLSIKQARALHEELRKIFG
jgi:hypothetical protein